MTDTQTKPTSILKAETDRLFNNVAVDGDFWTNPGTGGLMAGGPDGDPVAPYKNEHQRALLAREWFFQYGPPDAPPLPISIDEGRELEYRGPLSHLVRRYAMSLQSNGWDFRNHPDFETYARGVMASKHAPDFLRKNKTMLRRFPPQHLDGLGPGLCWERP